MPPIFQKLNFCYTLICTCLCSLFLGIGCSKLERVNEQDVEYRKDKKGNRILFKIGSPQPFGSGRIGQVSGNYEDGQKRFEVGFVNGVKHGTFYFWLINGLKKLYGS